MNQLFGLQHRRDRFEVNFESLFFIVFPHILDETGTWSLFQWFWLTSHKYFQYFSIFFSNFNICILTVSSAINASIHDPNTIFYQIYTIWFLVINSVSVDWHPYRLGYFYCCSFVRYISSRRVTCLNIVIV